MKNPNVIFIFADQLRKDALSIYGEKNIETPNIDKLMRQGVRFDQAVSTCPICTPYRGMLMTGKYPTHSGIVVNFIEPSTIQNPDCLAEVFKRNGYHTGFLGKWHLGSGVVGKDINYRDNYRLGKKYVPTVAESEFIPCGPKRLGFDYFAGYNFHLDFSNYWYYRDEPVKIYPGMYESDAVFADALDFIHTNKEKDNPFFLMLAPHQPHPPLTPEETPGGYLESIPESIVWSPNVPSDNPRKVQEMRCYYAMVKKIDDNIGMLMKSLEESGILEETIVVFTSDHGEMHGSHGRLHKMVPYREAIDVPLCMVWSGKVQADRANESLFTPMDFLPTLCSLTGIQIPDLLDGKDLSDAVINNKLDDLEDVLLMNYTSHWNEFFSETPATAADWQCWPEWRGVRSRRYTFVKWLDGKEECYDHEEDPWQMRNLCLEADHSQLVNHYRERLEQLLSEAHDIFPPGTYYAQWYDSKRELLRTGLGEIMQPV